MKANEDILQGSDQSVFEKNVHLLSNFFRILTMLEKTLERLARQRWYSESQYPEAYSEILSVIISVRTWAEDHKAFIGFQIYQDSLTLFIANIGEQVSLLIETSHHAPGKKIGKKSHRQKQQAAIHRSIDDMIRHLSTYPSQFDVFDTQVSDAIEKALTESFEESCLKTHKCRQRQLLLSQRGEKSLIFPWADSMTYQELVENRDRFRSEIVGSLKHYHDHTGHKSGCRCRGLYKMKGFRKAPRKIFVSGGHQEEYRIRMVECEDCGQRFSLLPSFIPREKHFSIDIIGNVLQSIVLFGQSLNGAFESTQMCGRKLRSRQTLVNWLQWAGGLHPATLLVRSGAECRGYFQEDEGFEKEPCLRTYTVVMADPETQLIWHMDYVDHVDEKNLCASFDDFLQKTNFTVKGVTKDKWKSSTNALKSVFFKVWIGFCHRHFLKKLNNALLEHQKESKRPWKEVEALYAKIKKILDTATHAGSLKARVKSLDDEAIKHPAVKERINDLIDNATHYTSHKQRSGITRTTSNVDNFLKNVKRKLKQVESFRDKFASKIMFTAMANIRNFVPFMPGAKNAGKSPFMLAGGETFDLPWMQVINVHNGFLFQHNN